ncbi:DEKNAAC100561 [Brettanomyces naardenensis]|uniref:DEKNAAC100561 n=1 Tax=Brettanomyces naardenensis TaxID=13370 RepID=A0A448YF45_BRENA|nr:DEKNAAC100561 [Brettanomyces naardenensis]
MFFGVPKKVLWVDTMKRKQSSSPSPPPLSQGQQKKAKILEVESSIPALKFYSHIERDGKALKLSQVFYDEHTDDFVKGVKYVLKKDPSLAELVVGGPAFRVCLKEKATDIKTPEFYFETLASGLISQQISGKAAAAIKKRLVENVSADGETFPLPSEFYSKKVEELRSFGLSMKKAEYVRRLAKAFMKDFSKEDLDEHVKFDDDYFKDVDDVSLRVDLERFKGVGPWSSSMFTMFAMERLDIFEPSDLGIRRGFTTYLKERPKLKKEVEKLFNDGEIKRLKRKPNAAKEKYINDYELMNAVAHQFRPYRSIFMFILWRMSETSVEALSK